MPSHTFFFRPMHLMYIAWHFLLSFALVLFTACGGGGDGATTTVSNPNTSPPTVSLAKVDLGGNLNTARSNHVAVQLPNNLLLVTGGSDGTTALKSSELYDPIKNKWTATSDMATARTGHTAVLLASGKVLVAGGFDGKATLKSAEIYDPSSGAWAPTIGTMNFTHNYHTASVLADGKVLIAGGVLGPATNVDATATEIYDPTLGTFSAGPNLPSARQGHTSTVLANGKVLFVGSSIGSSTKAHILSYTSPATFIWPDLATPAVVTGSLTNGRWNHTATLLPNGKVLVAGGFGTNPNSAELYDPVINAWTSAGSLANGRSMHTSTLLRNGKVLIIGGFDGVNVLSSIEQYDPTVADPTKGWSTYAKILNTQRAMHTSTLLSNDKVLVSGTYLQGSGTVSSSSELWAP